MVLIFDMDTYAALLPLKPGAKAPGYQYLQSWLNI